MKLSDFILLKEEEKKMTVLHDGILLAKRTSGAYMVFLFQLGSYYVETWCHYHTKMLEEYFVFANDKALSPYLESISIDELFDPIV